MYESENDICIRVVGVWRILSFKYVFRSLWYFLKIKRKTLAEDGDSKCPLFFLPATPVVAPRWNSGRNFSCEDSVLEVPGAAP